MGARSVPVPVSSDAAEFELLDPRSTRVGAGVAVPPAGQHFRVVGPELFR